MKVGKYFIAILVIMLFFYATNPTKDQFVEYTKDEVSEETKTIGVSSKSFIEDLVASVDGTPISEISDIKYHRDDFGVFSIHEINGQDLNYKYLGFAKIFILIESRIDVENINIAFKDFVNIIQDNRVIDENVYMYFRFISDEGKAFKISLECISGPQIEYFILNEENFNMFKENNNSSFKMYEHQVLSQGRTLGSGVIMHFVI